MFHGIARVSKGLSMSVIYKINAGPSLENAGKSVLDAAIHIRRMIDLRSHHT